MSPRTIGDWLLQIQLRHLESTFVLNGYDNLSFIGTDVLTRESLKFLGVKDAKTCQKILTSSLVQKCPKVPKLRDHSPPFDSLSDWLSYLCLEQYLDNFVHAGCGSLDQLDEAWQLALKKNKFDISCIGHRMRLLASLDIKDLKTRLNKHVNHSTGDVFIEDFDINFEDDEKRQDSLRHSSSIPPTPAPSPFVHDNSTIQSNRFFQPLDVLQTTSFDVGFLGVHAFDDIDPTEEALILACQKRLQKGVLKVPLITLQITFCSIRLTDPEQGTVSMEHAIPNIQCAALNTDHKTFAYVVSERVAIRPKSVMNPSTSVDTSRQNGSKGSPCSVVAPCKKRMCYIFQTIDADNGERRGKEVMIALRVAFETAFKFVTQSKSKSKRSNVPPPFPKS